MHALCLPYAWLPMRHLWAFLVVMAVFGLAIFGAGYVIQGQNVLQGKLYFGTLVQGTQPISIILPQGAVLSETIVTEGQRVTKGQTLAALNTDMMNDLLARDEQKLLTRRFEQLCLLSDAPGDQIEIPSHIPTGTIAELRLAKESCLAVKEGALDEQITVQKELLLERRTLLQDQLRLIQAEGQGRMEQAIKVLLAKSALDEDIAKLDAALSDYAVQRKAGITQAIEAATVDIARLEAQIAHRRRLLNAPRLTAPAAGMITHVRHIGGEPRAQRQGVVLLNIIDPDAQEFHLNMVIHEDDFAALGDYRLFEFRILGFDRRDSTPLEAVWDAAQSSVVIEGGKITVSLTLTQAAQDRLQQRLGRLGPKQTQYASRIEFGGAPMPLMALIKGAVISYF